MDPTPGGGLPIPDLLDREPHLAVDREALLDLLGLAYLGRELGTALDEALAAAQLRKGAWKPEFFTEDLFIADFARACSTLTLGSATYPANQRFLRKALANVPVDLETVRMRQAILSELSEDPDLRLRFESLYKSLFALLSLFGTPGYRGSLDTASIHFEILRQSKRVIDSMTEDFAGARSRLRRLSECGRAIQESREYRTLADLLEYEGGWRTSACACALAATAASGGCASRPWRRTGTTASGALPGAACEIACASSPAATTSAIGS